MAQETIANSPNPNQPEPTHWRPMGKSTNVCGSTQGPFAYARRYVSCKECLKVEGFGIHAA